MYTYNWHCGKSHVLFFFSFFRTQVSNWLIPPAYIRWTKSCTRRRDSRSLNIFIERALNTYTPSSQLPLLLTHVSLCRSAYCSERPVESVSLEDGTTSSVVLSTAVQQCSFKGLEKGSEKKSFLASINAVGRLENGESECGPVGCRTNLCNGHSFFF